MTRASELSELLGRAGLDVIGDARDEGVIPPSAAWRPIIAVTAEPTVAVRRDRPDLVAELNAEWHRLAVAHRIIDDDGAFLISVAGDWPGRSSPYWTRVRLTARWDLAGVLGDRPGKPEFVTAAPDGEALLGATTEEYETWLVVVDRVTERREAAARAAARETPEQRAAAWAVLSRGPRPRGRLREAWANGLGGHAAAPDDVRHDLLGLSHRLLWRPLPAPLVDAAIDHPDAKVRELTAEVQPNLDARQWARLILGEADPRRRWILTLHAADRRAALPETAHVTLAADPSARVREETARLPGLPVESLATLAADPDPAVRASACGNGWARLPEPHRRTLLSDPDDRVRATALLLHHRDHPMSRPVFDTLDHRDRAAESCRLERGLAEHLCAHEEPALRAALAANPHLAPDLLARLAHDTDHGVRFVVSLRPDLTEEQRAAIPVDVDPHGLRHALPWVVALHHDPRAMRRLAASSHPLVRGSVARARHLPPDVVERLARDEDRVVRLFLTESCDDAPADLLLEVWRWWNGSLSHPGRPRTHPNFPRRGLLRYAEDPNPRMRQLALDDPDATAELVERFSRDPHREVRLRAATDPRLTPASAVRLLDDPRLEVRRAAARHPRLPAGVLARLLWNVDLAEDAARNPALPVSAMRRMVHRLRTETGAGAQP
ncbi:PE-PGRS family protein [Streptomyces sp. LX-29]|uniref:PE-PGRS family protein n=1 Tax=Streptomyces sp. LX-29 TaxID=2900152 RepID=UPI00240E737D|nr:PE-PGRS family protein [Streptomyces sp. LX-29]WFB11220.1 PE-PGRS family protein [Streptomyces sp. LX-29]